MKKVIMNQTLKIMFNNNEQLNIFINKEKYIIKETKNKNIYLIREE